MAGNYMDAPNFRLAWDRDGSLLTFISAGGAVTNQNATNRRIVNSEDEAGLAMGTINRVAVVFPVPTDCAAIFVATNTSVGLTWLVESSKDTTNGVDGTWDSQFLTGLNLTQAVKPNYRELSDLLMLQTNSSSSDLRGIRLMCSGTSPGTLRAFHVYGSPSTLATKDRLAFWHPTLDVKTSPYYFDWGNVPRSSSEDRPFRIKNLSLDLEASDIDVYVEALTPGIPSVAGMHTISADGGSTFLSGYNIPSVLPGEISDVLILRRTVPSNALVSVWSARVAADVNLWKETT